MLTALAGGDMKNTQNADGVLSGEPSIGSVSRPGSKGSLKNKKPNEPEQIDTGKAAMLAYTNLNQVSEEIIEWKKSPQTRNIHPTHSSGDGKPVQKNLPNVHPALINNTQGIQR